MFIQERFGTLLMLMLFAGVLSSRNYAVAQISTSHMRVPFIGQYNLSEACKNTDTNTYHRNGAGYAIDAPMGIGTPIYSPVNGTVVSVLSEAFSGGYGNTVLIRDEHNLYTRLAHLAKVYARAPIFVLIQPYQTVTQGQLIGLSGDTGYGPAHLHWHVQDGANQAASNPVNLDPVPGVNVINCNSTIVGTANGPALPGNPYNSCSEYASAFQDEPHVALFDNKNCRGNPLRLYGSPDYAVRYNLNVSTDFNDRTRSIYIPNGWTVKVGGNIDDQPYALTRSFSSTQPDLDSQYYAEQGGGVRIGYNPAPIHQNGWDMISYVVVSRPGNSGQVGGYTWTGGGSILDTVEIYENPGCTGMQYGWHDPTNGWFNTPDYMNDKASCVIVDPGWSVLVSEHIAGGGGKRCLTSTNPDLHFATYDNGTNINNTISSLYIYNDEICAGQATVGVEPGDTVTVWENFDFTGLRYGWHDAGLFNVPDYLANKISSIGIMPGWSVAVYDFSNGTGGVRCYSATAPSLGHPFSTPTSTNNNIESVRVFQDSSCGGNLWMAELRPLVLEGNEQPIVASSVPGTLVSSTLYAGQPTYVDYIVENSGYATASPYFDLSLWLDNQLIYENFHWIVGPGERVGVSDLQLDVSEPGWHELKLVIDGRNNVDELIETNNVWETQFYWYPFLPAIPGDLDKDGDVDIFDYNQLVTDYGRTGAPGFIPSDIDNDGDVDIYDYNILVTNYGATSSSASVNNNKLASPLTTPDSPSDVYFSSESNSFDSTVILSLNWRDNSDNEIEFILDWSLEGFTGGAYTTLSNPPDTGLRGTTTSSVLAVLPCQVDSVTRIAYASVRSSNDAGVSSAAEVSSEIIIPACPAESSTPTPTSTPTSPTIYNLYIPLSLK